MGEVCPHWRWLLLWVMCVLTGGGFLLYGKVGIPWAVAVGEVALNRGGPLLWEAVAMGEVDSY